MDTEKQKVILGKLLPVLFGFYVMGFVDIIGAATKYVKDDFNLSNSIANTLPLMLFVWFFIMSIPSGIIQDKIGRRKSSCIGIGLTGIGMIIPLISYSFYSVIAGFILLGIGNAIVQVSLNPLMLFVSPAEKYTGFLSLSQFIKAIASLLGPLITTAFFVYTQNWKYIFLVYAILSTLSLLWLYFTHIEEHPQKEVRPTFKTSFKLLFSDKMVLLMVLGIFLSVGIDVGMNVSIPEYMGKKFSMSRESATNIISIYFAAKMIGTFLGSILLTKLSNRKFFIWTMVLTLLAFGGIYSDITKDFVSSMIFIAGLGASNVFALIFSLTVQRMPERSNELSGLMIMAVSGGAVIPFIMGFAVDVFGTNGNILILSLCAVYIFFLAIINASKKSIVNNTN
jgi:fucose permease